MLKKSNIRLDIEFLRFLSSFGIVWFHSGVAGANFGYSGLIVFVILSVYFSGSIAKNDMINSLQSRFSRIVRPWVLWSVVFFCIDIFKGRNFLGKNDFDVSFILVGGAVHLWYLPFIFFGLFILDVIKLNFHPRLIFWAAVIFAGATLILAPVWRPWSLQLPMPFPQYFHAFFAFFLGVVFLYLKSVEGIFPILVVGLLIVGAGALLGMQGVGLPYFVGSLFSLLIFFPISVFRGELTSDFFRILGRHSFGIYLMHPIIFGFSRKIVEIDSFLFPVFSAALSLLLVHTIYISSVRVYRLIF